VSGRTEGKRIRAGAATRRPVVCAGTSPRCASYNRAVPDSPKSITVYRWRVFDTRKKRWRELRWHMTEIDAAAWAKAEGAQLERIEGSAEERHNVRGDTPGSGMGNLPGPRGRM
jgi:hypothetical protein